MPFEIDVVERRIRQLEIEKAALAKETDDASKQRLDALEAELAVARRGARRRWSRTGRTRRTPSPRSASCKERLEQARTDAEQAERDGDLERAAQLRYGTIRELEREIEAKTAAPRRAPGRAARC